MIPRSKGGGWEGETGLKAKFLHWARLRGGQRKSSRPMGGRELLVIITLREYNEENKILLCCAFLVVEDFEDYGSEKYYAFNNLLPVGIDAHEGHTKVDYTDECSTNNHSEYCT